tara:strand:+ start:43 stop:621 length:579 start_codon:yes stop_codon:yes gene_type:complete
MKIYDDFLRTNDFLKIRNTLLGEYFPWYKTVVSISNVESDTMLCDDIDNYQFCNHLYREWRPNLPQFNIVLPILMDARLRVSSVLRVKANLTPKTNKVVEHCWHCDGYTPCSAAIYYVNSNDGYTKFEDGTKVESVENRLVVFNTQDRHTGSTCTDTSVRCVINFNYHSIPDDVIQKLPENYNKETASMFGL